MPDIGWSEMMMIAVLALIVIGPKDLPRVMKTMGHWMRKARSVTREFQSSVDEMIREADLDDARKAVQSAASMNPSKIISDAVDPTGDMTEEMRDVEREASKEASTASADKSGADNSGADSSGADKKPGAGASEAEPAAGAGDAAPEATVVKTPLNVAPAHSLTPPPEESTTTSSDDDGGKPDVQQKSA